MLRPTALESDSCGTTPVCTGISPTLGTAYEQVRGETTMNRLAGIKVLAGFMGIYHILMGVFGIASGSLAAWAARALWHANVNVDLQFTYLATGLRKRVEECIRHRHGSYHRDHHRGRGTKSWLASAEAPPDVFFFAIAGEVRRPPGRCGISRPSRSSVSSSAPYSVAFLVSSSSAWESLVSCWWSLSNSDRTPFDFSASPSRAYTRES